MSVIDELRKLDEQRTALIEKAKSEALAQAEQAIATLNELGFNYHLTQGQTTPRQTIESRAPRTPFASGGTGTRRAGQREAVLAVIEAHTDGIAPGAILVAMNAESDADKTSVRNALSALKKNNSVASKDGKYFPA
jgi:hypothetical protein